MKTIIIKVEVPENFPVNHCDVELKLYTWDRYISYDKHDLEILPRPTDEEIIRWSESTTMNAAAAQHRITAAEWMRNHYHGEEEQP